MSTFEKVAFPLARLVAKRSDAAVISQRAAIEIDRENWSKAIVLGKLAVLTDRRFISAYLVLGKSYLKSGNPSKAQATYEQGLQIDPQNSYLHEQMGDLHRYLENIDESRKSYNVALALRPGDERVIGKLARLAELR